MDASAWNRFDFVGVLRYAPYASRRAPLDAELARVGLAGRATEFWTAEDVYARKGIEFFPRTEFLKKRTTLAVLTLYHLRMVRVALALGAERLLVVEDDVRFRADAEEVWRTVDDLPADFDIAFLDAFAAMKARGVPGFAARIAANRASERWVRPETHLLRSCACYALSRRGAEAFVAKLEAAANGGEPLRVCDQFLGRLAAGPELRAYLAHPLAAVQALSNESTSGADAIRAGYAALGVDRSLYRRYEGDEP